MSHSLKTKMVAFFLVSSSTIIIMVFCVTRFIIQSEFSSYIQETHKKQDQEILNYLNNIIDQSGKLDMESLLAIAHRGMMEGYSLSIYNPQKKLVWSMEQNQSGMMMPGMMSPGPNYGKYTEKEYVLKNKQTMIGYVHIGRYQSSFFSAEDLHFQHSLYQGLLLVAFLSLVTAVLFSFIFAGQLTSPIVTIKNAADRLQRGNLKTRAHVKTNTREIKELASSVNHLGQSLENQETLRRRLTSDISHELRTPLNVLLSHIEALQDGIWDPTPQRLQVCHSEIVRLTSLIKDLEKLTQLDNDHIQLKKESILLNKLIKEIILQFQSKFNEKAIQVHFNEISQVFLFIDPHKIRQVFINLLSNAFKYTPCHGEVEITLDEKSKEASIEIRDTGVGISEKDLPHIFERFYRGDPSRSRDTGGTGIGLSIVYSIIKAHQGSITVHSDKDHGSSFIIRLPKDLPEDSQ